jgi:hypothetical protein
MLQPQPRCAKVSSSLVADPASPTRLDNLCPHSVLYLLARIFLPPLLIPRRTLVKSLEYGQERVHSRMALRLANRDDCRGRHAR